MEKSKFFFVFSILRKIKTNTWKKDNLYCFSQKYKKWSVIHEKKSVVTDFHKNIKIKLMCTTAKKTSDVVLAKPQKLNSFT